MNIPAQSFKNGGIPARRVPRLAREVAIAEHLWLAFDELAASMATDRESLINQAMFVFARLNGFLESRPGPEAPPAGFVEDDRAELEARVLRTADELQKLLKDKGSAARDDDEPAVDEAPPPPADHDGPSELAGLYLQTDTGASERISKDRFIVGRHKQCDLVIDSGKISRQHAVILREGDEYFIEDQKSANGTWFAGRRLNTRRKIESGDEYFICNQRIRLVIVP